MLFPTKKSDDLILLIDFFSLQSSSASGLIGRTVEQEWPLGSFMRQPVTTSRAVKIDEFGVYLFRRQCTL